MADATRTVYRFGPFLLSPAERSLVKEDSRVPLTPKAFDLLVLLVENSGHLLTKEELMNRLWPDSFVEEANLTQNISTLRKALGTEAGIETVPKLGYRFITEVSEVPGIKEEIIVEEHTSSRVVIEAGGDQLSNRSAAKISWLVLPTPKLMAIAGVLLVSVVAGGLALKSYLNRQGGSPRNPFGNRTVDTWRNEEGESNDGGSFSHSGTRIAYSKRQDGFQNIWVKQASDHPPVRITKGEWNDWTPLWSSDDERIAFISDRENRTAIWVSSSITNSPRAVETLDTGGFRPLLKLWSKDEKRLYYELRSNLYELNIDTHRIRPITNFDPTTLPAKTFSLSKDERQIAYTNSENGHVNILVASRDGGTTTQATDDSAFKMSVVWHPDNKRIIYSASTDGTLQVFESRIDGSQPTQLTLGAASETVTDVDENGNVCVVSTDSESTLWVCDIEKGVESELSVGSRVVLWPSIAPDGKHVAIHSNDSISNLIDSTIWLVPVE